MADKYSNYADLLASETQGCDYSMKVAACGSRILVLAPHAGGIERGTSEIALSVAAKDLSFYLFEGTKPQGNDVLHITSTNFDEPTAIEMVGESDWVIG